MNEKGREEKKEWRRNNRHGELVSASIGLVGGGLQSEIVQRKGWFWMER